MWLVVFPLLLVGGTWFSAHITFTRRCNSQRYVGHLEKK